MNLVEIPIVRLEQPDFDSKSLTSTESYVPDNSTPENAPMENKSLNESQSLMNFIKGNIGSGILSMPVVLRFAGLWTGFALIFFSGIISTYLMNVLVRTARSVRLENGLDRSKMDYTETVFYVFKYGPIALRKPKGKIKHTINVFLLITQIGFLCIYVLFLTENIRYFVMSFSNTPMNFYVVGFLVTLALIPMCLYEDMRILAFLSYAANLATLVGFILIFTYLFYSGLQPYTNLPVYTNLRGLLIGFSIAMVSFEGISLVLPIENTMAHPELYTHSCGVLNVGMIVVIGLNAAVAFFGFLRFGEKSEGSITLNIPEKPYWCAPVKPLFMLTIVVSYLIQFYVPAAIFSRLMEKLRYHREGSERTRYINIRLMRIFLVLFTYLMVIAIPKLELMISLIGSFASSVLAFIMPALLEIVHLWADRRRIKRFWLTVVAKHLVFVFIGLVTFIGGTTATLIQLAGAIGPPPSKIA